MEVKIFKTKEEIAKQSAKYFEEVLKSNDNPVLGLATGSTPIETYQELIKKYNDKEISFANVLSFNLDEYVGIDKDHEQSYYHFMCENLFNHVDIKKENINIPAGKGDLNKICDDYNQKLKDHKIDIQILGIGTNGHIAFNEPGTPFNQVTHITNLAQSTIEDNARFFNSVDEVPTQAISMGLANIMDAKQIVLIAIGESKQKAVYELVKGEKRTDVPATILQDHPNVTILLDEEAAGLL